MDHRRISTSLALIVLICFFLPWIQLSCGTSENRLSGVDLAREGHGALYLIPLLMLAVVFFGIVRSWKDRRELSALIGLLAGLISAYLMNRERTRAEDTTALIAVALTGWFWLAFGAAIGLVILGAVHLLKRSRRARSP